MMRQYASPYKGYLAGAVLLNILSAIFNIFSFAILVPLLNILFKVDSTVYQFIPWDTEMNFKDKLVNNFYFYVTDFSTAHGLMNTLLLLGGAMILFTLLKTSCYFGSNAVMVPISTGIVRDIRSRVYHKILALPIGFFTEERKGDIIARITGDVAEVENSITASIAILIKDPSLILLYFGFLTFMSPDMMLITVVFAPYSDRPVDYLDNGSDRKATQEGVHRGSESLERHYVPGGRNPWRPSRHQGFQRREEDGRPLQGHYGPNA